MLAVREPDLDLRPRARAGRAAETKRTPGLVLYQPVVELTAAQRAATLNQALPKPSAAYGRQARLETGPACMGALLLSCELRTDGSEEAIAVGADAPTASSGDASALLAGSPTCS
jgi:hypothetical protein